MLLSNEIIIIEGEDSVSSSGSDIDEFMESIEPKTSTRTYEFGDLSDYEIDVVEAPSYFA